MSYKEATFLPYRQEDKKWNEQEMKAVVQHLIFVSSSFFFRFSPFFPLSLRKKELIESVWKRDHF